MSFSIDRLGQTEWKSTGFRGSRTVPVTGNGEQNI